jgi:hypothetical protein
MSERADQGTVVLGQQPLPTSTPAMATSPPTMGISRISMGMAANEIILTVGHTRQIIDPSTGNPGAHPFIEWLAALSMSPTTALQLKGSLDDMLTTYESAFGEIPNDPNFALQTVGQRPVPREREGDAVRPPSS